MPSLLKIHLIRHAESEANILGIVCGQIDSPISKKGFEYLNATKDRQHIKSLIHLPCFSSPLLRARMTAEVLEFKNITTDNRLKETNTGDFSEKDFLTISSQYPDFQHHKTNLQARYPNGESTFEMIERSQDFIQKLISIPCQDEIVIVSHGGPLNGIVSYLLGSSVEAFPNFLFKNASLCTLSRKSDSFRYWNLDCFNIT